MGDTYDLMYVRCSTHARKDITAANASCHTNYTRQERIEEAIVSFLSGLTDLAAVQRVRMDQRNSHRERARLEEITGELAEAQRRRQRLALAYAAGAMDMMVYQAADEEIQRQVTAWKDEQRELDGILASVVGDEDRLSAVETVRSILEAGLDQAEARELSTALQNAGIRVWCEEGRVVRVEMI